MADKVKHPKVIISGMHGSGTLLVASLMAKLLVRPENHLSKDDSAKLAADFEEQRFHRLHQRILAEDSIPGEPGYSDWGWTEKDREVGHFAEFREEAERLVSAWAHFPASLGWEDPRGTLFLEDWDSLLEEPRYVLVYRFPWDVADSIQRMGIEVFLKNPEYTYRIWAFYNKRLRDFYIKHADRCLLVSINALEAYLPRLIFLLGEKLGLSMHPEQEAALHQVFKDHSLRSIWGEDPLIGLTAAAWPDCTRLLSELDGLADISSDGLWHPKPYKTRLSRPDLPAKQKPELSVITPCYEQGTFLVEAIASVERYAPPNCELIIVNDGSQQPRTLEILELLRGYGYFIVNQVNAGLSAARNKGIGLARADYILPLDDDNRIENYLQEAISILDSCPEVGVVYGDRNDFGMRNRVIPVPDFDFFELLKVNYIDACAVFRKQIWIECGGYDPRMSPIEDWEFWIQAAENGWGFHHIHRIALDYRTRPGSLITKLNSIELWEEFWKRIRLKHSESYWALANENLKESARKLELVSAQNQQLRFDLNLWETTNLRLRADLDFFEVTNRRLQSDLELLGTANQELRAELESESCELQMLRTRIGEQEEALSEQDEALARITGSTGWRILSYYGRLKHRYLLPVYKLFGQRQPQQIETKPRQESSR